MGWTEMTFQVWATGLTSLRGGHWLRSFPRELLVLLNTSEEATFALVCAQSYQTPGCIPRPQGMSYLGSLPKITHPFPWLPLCEWQSWYQKHVSNFQQVRADTFSHPAVHSRMPVFSSERYYPAVPTCVCVYVHAHKLPAFWGAL